jgi:hypothetical protein
LTTPASHLDQTRFRRILLRTLLLPPLVMLGLATVLFWQINRLTRLQHQVTQSTQVILQVPINFSVYFNGCTPRKSLRVRALGWRPPNGS